MKPWGQRVSGERERLERARVQRVALAIAQDCGWHTIAEMRAEVAAIPRHLTSQEEISRALLEKR